MRIYEGTARSFSDLRRPKLTLGTFDGVHLGHQRVLADLLAWARETGSDAVVLTFDRKPRRVLADKAAGDILSLPHRLLLFERIGIDAAVVLQFDQSFAACEPEDFVRETLLDRIRASGVLLGHDTRFGRGARGDWTLMARLGREWGFETRATEVVELDGQPVSSTRLRSAIRAGDLGLAERLLGRRVSVYGTVISGTRRGAVIGFPTANLDLRHEVLPPQGVYATLALIDGAWHPAVTNIGRPPSLKSEGPRHISQRVTVETHVLDFAGNLYGTDLEVQFVAMIRPEETFSSASALAERIAGDIVEARRILAKAQEAERLERS